MRQLAKEMGKFQSYSQAHKTSGKWPKSSTNPFDALPAHGVTTQQVSKKTEETFQVKARFKQATLLQWRKTKRATSAQEIMKHTQAQIDVRSVVIHNTLRDLDVKLVSTNVRIVINLVISVAYATRRKNLSTKGIQVPEHINWRLVQLI